MTKKIKLSENAESVAKSRYFNDGEDWEKCTFRVADAVACIEKERELYTNKFHEMIYNMDFIPAGRILRNSGRDKGSLLNCYVLPIDDSIESIGEYLKNSLCLWSEGGGCGSLFSPLRPKGDPIKGKGGHSSGMVSYIKAADAVSKTIESGGQRRAAALACCDVSHPEIIDFINAKLVDGEISHFNISVLVNEEFIRCVETDSDWTFKFKQKEYGKIRARDLWNLIIKNMIERAEPGLLNSTNLYKNNSWYYDPVVSTNPCMTGDSLVSVADGRGLVTFKELAEAGDDVPVFSMNDQTKKIEVKMMRRPRKTGSNQKILKIYLDNGTSFKANDVHKVTMFNGDEKQLKDLVVGDRLHHMIKYQSKLSTILENEKNQIYVWMTNGYQRTQAEHRIVGEFLVGRSLKKDEVVHHKDYNYQNNSFDNLEVMKKVNHDENHRKDKMGLNNPIHRFPEKNYFKNHPCFYGIKNGNSMGFTKEEMMEKAVEFCKTLGRKSHVGEWKDYCRTNHFPYDSFYIFGDYGHIGGFLEEAAKQANVVNFDSYHHSCYNRFLKIKESTDLDVFFDNGIKVRKHCECCGNEMILDWGNREHSFCSTNCKKIGSTVLVEATMNFKVVKIEEIGFEDVYNGTVDDNHNYYVFTGEDLGKNGKPRMNFINSKNCGEAVLENFGSCCLGSLVLPNFITGNINTNWKKLENTIKLAVRFLDNVIDVNKYSLKEIAMKGQNSRRIGLGILGLAEYLFAKELRYGSKDSVIEIEKLMRFIRDVAYEASISLSVEKGSFPKFDPNMYGNSSFVRKLPAQLRMDIKNKGVRNVTLLSMAPNGTISLLCDYTGGIEPLMHKAYRRNDRVGERIYIHSKYKQLLLSGEPIPNWFVSSSDLLPRDHFEIQSIIQKYTDGACSKTINMPKGTTTEQLNNLLLEYIRDLKGCTVYVDESRGGQVYNQLSEEEAFDIVSGQTIGQNSLDIDDVECNCAKKTDEENDEEIEVCDIPLKKEN